MLKATGAWVININHDDFFSRNRNNWSRNQKAAIPAYHHIFTPREANVEEIKPINAHVQLFPFAYHPGIHRPVKALAMDRGSADVDVIFVGTWERERCRLLEQLVREVPARYAIWGTQWEKVASNSPLVPFLRHRPIILNDMAKAIGAAKVALAFLRKENRDTYTQRSFEIPACNGVLLAERTRQHLAYYDEDREAAFFDPASPSELVFKVRALLSKDQWRESIRAAGRARLLRDRHTYRDRLEELLRRFECWRANRSEATRSRANTMSAGLD
jgi:spore maturation protein CgeB